MKVKYAILIIIVSLIMGCNSSKYNIKPTASEIQLTINYTTGNWVNPANITDTIIIPPDSDGIIDYTKIKLKGNYIAPKIFNGGFVEVVPQKSIDVRLLQKHVGFNQLMQYPGNGKYNYK
ncbi:MAG: hypothetical protein KAG97_07980 [Victivallales bacterium]|nr:hypothetical protein [Victivallales bacterium]